jgi:hypothetical protein
VVTPGGIVIGNKVGLCVEHHGDVTGDIGGHRARIAFDAGCFWWEVKVYDNGHGTHSWWQRHSLPLQYQPPGATAAAPPAPGDSAPSAQEDLCPECGKPKHPKPRKPLPRRKTKEWTLTVPEDAEIGSDVLDGWAEDLAVVLGFGDLTSRLVRYHAVATGLAWVMMHRQQFVEDLVEASR